MASAFACETFIRAMIAKLSTAEDLGSRRLQQYQRQQASAAAMTAQPPHDASKLQMLKSAVDEDVHNMVVLLQLVFEHAPDPTLFAYSPDLCSALIMASQNPRYNLPIVNSVCMLLNAFTTVTTF